MPPDFSLIFIGLIALLTIVAASSVRSWLRERRRERQLHKSLERTEDLMRRNGDL
jgi:hypothetical protein